MRRLVAVVGPGAASEAERAAAHEVGERLADAGVVVVCGGLGGVMEAACRGAQSRGGLTVGILPGDDPAQANAAVDVALATGLREARNVLVARVASALVAIGGEYGTLSEIAFALKIGRPVIGLHTWELRRGDEADTGIRIAASPQHAVELALAVPEQ